MSTFGRSPFTRRSLIQGLGLGTASLGLPSGRFRRAQAAPSIPKRFVVFCGSGMIYDDPWPKAPGGGAPGETGWEMGEAHAPLAPWKAKALYVDGIGMVSQEVDRGGSKGNAHQQGSAHALAAANTASAGLPGGVTIDQFIAQALNRPAPVTAVPSLQLCIGFWMGDLLDGYFASAPNTKLPMDWHPKDGFKRAFGDVAAMAGNTGGMALADQQRQQQLAVLGFARDDFSRLATRLGKDDRLRLEVHGALLGDLEKRMRLAPGAAPGGGCASPVLPPTFEKCQFSCWNQQYLTNFNLSRDYNLRIAAAALACDRTRVVSIALQVPDAATSFVRGTLGNGDLHGLTHMVCDNRNPASKDPAMRKPVRDANVIEARTVASFVEQLAQIPEADGSSLLDHTVILFAGHIGYGSHDLARLPWAVVGGGATGLRLGRYVKLPKNPKSSAGRPHNDFLLTLARAVGVPATSFGNASICTGPIAEMTA